jgi:CBS domain-containing protein
MIRAQKINKGTMTQTEAIDAASATMRELKSGRAPVTDAGVVAARDIGFLWVGRVFRSGGMP